MHISARHAKQTIPHSALIKNAGIKNDAGIINAPIARYPLITDTISPIAHDAAAYGSEIHANIAQVHATPCPPLNLCPTG